jgi:hypothetical protein
MKYVEIVFNALPKSYKSFVHTIRRCHNLLNFKMFVGFFFTNKNILDSLITWLKMKMKHYSLRLYNLLELLMMKRIKQGGNMIKSTKKGRHITFYHVSCILKNGWKCSIKPSMLSITLINFYLKTNSSKQVFKIKNNISKWMINLCLKSLKKILNEIYLY